MCRMSSAVSSNALVRRLGFFFLIITHLLQNTFVEGLGDVLGVRRQPLKGNFAQRHQFVRFDILPLALGEAVKKHRAMPSAVGDQQAIAAGPTSPRSCNALLDDAATQVSIDKPLLRPRDCLAQAAVGNSLASCKSREPSGSENPQSAS